MKKNFLEFIRLWNSVFSELHCWYLQLIFKLISADISWSYHQIVSFKDCAKHCFINTLGINFNSLCIASPLNPLRSQTLVAVHEKKKTTHYIGIKFMKRKSFLGINFNPLCIAPLHNPLRSWNLVVVYEKKKKLHRN